MQSARDFLLAETTFVAIVLPVEFTWYVNGMKILSLRLTWLCLVALVPLARAQLPGSTTLNASMTKLFGNITAFSSQAEVSLLDKAQKETTSLTLNFALLDNKVRMEIDMNLLKTRENAELVAQFKSMGMGQLITILRPDRRYTLMIYPGLKAYAEVPIDPAEAAISEGDLKIEKTRLGKETLDGHPCEKTRVVISAKNGERHEALAWYATDLKQFPLKVQMNEAGETVVMVFRQPKLEKPPASAFEAPAGYTKHASLEALMQTEVLKRLRGSN